MAVGEWPCMHHLISCGSLVHVKAIWIQGGTSRFHQRQRNALYKEVNTLICFCFIKFWKLSWILWAYCKWSNLSWGINCDLSWIFKKTTWLDILSLQKHVMKRIKSDSLNHTTSFILGVERLEKLKEEDTLWYIPPPPIGPLVKAMPPKYINTQCLTTARSRLSFTHSLTSDYRPCVSVVSPWLKTRGTQAHRSVSDGQVRQPIISSSPNEHSCEDLRHRFVSIQLIDWWLSGHEEDFNRYHRCL